MSVSRTAVVCTCRAVAPASRRSANSRRRPSAAIANVFATEMARGPIGGGAAGKLISAAGKRIAAKALTRGAEDVAEDTAETVGGKAADASTRSVKHAVKTVAKRVGRVASAGLT